MIETPNFILAAPQAFVLAMTCIILLIDVFSRKKYSLLTYMLTQLTMLGAIFVTLLIYDYPEAITFNGSFIHDRLSALLNLFICGISFFVFLYSRNYVRERKMPYGDYYVLSLFSVLGMMVLVSSYSFISLYIGLELLSLPLYALIGLQRNNGTCIEAAMKYFIMGAVASGILLYGLSMIYGATGNLAINAVSQAISAVPPEENLILVFGLVFLVVGLAFKLGAVPFHMWVPDVYQGAPNTATLFIATATKIAAFALAIRLLVNTLPLLHIDWQHLLIAISILSMGLGNFVAIVQTNFKRMLAYSSIAHMGYMLLGLIAATPTGYGAATYYMLAYAIMSLGAFGMIVLLSRAGFEAEEISDLRGLNQRNPWIAFLLLLILFSMAGIPPLVGFFAKVTVLEALIAVDLVWLAAVALLFAIVGAYYYIRVVKVMYFDDPEEVNPIFIEAVDMRMAMSLNGILILVLGLFPGGLFDLCRAAF